MIKPLNILVSAYACGPNWGSEIGMGWNWVINLCNSCQLTVIVESEFRQHIEPELLKTKLKYFPKFHYIDIGERGQRLFKKQGSAIFYIYYRRWQKKAFIKAKELIKLNSYDIIHQLNMIGYREPGYLWKIRDIPFVYGPVGGYVQYPSKYYGLLTLRNMLFYFLRNSINRFQMHYLLRPKKAYKKAKYVICTTPETKAIVQRYTLNEPIIMAETGAYRIIEKGSSYVDTDFKITIIWVGFIKGSKALPIALKTIASSKYKDLISFKIVGEGPDMKYCQKLATQLKLTNIQWLGKINNKQCNIEIKKADLLFFTSVLEATSTVIFEALQNSTPVLCHDICGFGYVIDETCGIKIPLETPDKSILNFKKQIDRIIEQPQILKSLQKTCKTRLEKYYWDNKIKKMVRIYQESIKP